MLLLQLILNILLGNPHERQEKIRENIRLLCEEKEFNDLIEKHGRWILLNLKIRKHIGKYNIQDLRGNSNNLKNLCEELEEIIKKRNKKKKIL
ncbi:hypothetical protein CN971_32130 [Bacillus thuringiensis]|uniref:Uncharacterized protein n=1 Tax=Bacillus thuringiensis TaxID=1428 RepID=A0A9X7BMD3_BACTU|nr:hypothetical protein [Bacillus thuringiensis]MDA2185944.1 hypothetical protein [Bacillus cereus]PFV28642.1 hypothetical protein COK99_20080 [Bacillus thuringiensis]PGN17266.1 hypothetical protein CN971_32130 [Bacillus thuringiensis]PGN26689.1 hypothetical protein CN969_06800 [Bacillus thuringiensis]